MKSEVVTCVFRQRKRRSRQRALLNERKRRQRERERERESEDEDGRQAVLEAVEFWCYWKGRQHKRKRKHLDETEKEDT